MRNLPSPGFVATFIDSFKAHRELLAGPRAPAADASARLDGAAGAARAAVLSERALSHMKERAFEKALADWSAAIAMLPPRADSAAPLLTPADTPASVLSPEDREGLLKEWVAEAEAGRAVHPTLALSMHGMFLHLRGNYAEAMACYDYALHLSPGLVDVLLKRASLWFEKEDLSSALADFETALKAEPQSADVYCHRGQLRILQNELSAALDDLRKAVELDPDSVLAHIQLGMALHRSSQPTQARSIFAAAEKKFPESPDVLNYYGELLVEAGDLDGARTKFTGARRDAAEMPPRSSREVEALHPAMHRAE